jgi:hypothetical protein
LCSLQIKTEYAESDGGEFGAKAYMRKESVVRVLRVPANKLKRFMWYTANLASIIVFMLGLLAASFFYITDMTDMVNNHTATDKDDYHFFKWSGNPDDLIRTIKSSNFTHLNWQIPVAILLVSLMWWENFVSSDPNIIGRKLKLSKLKLKRHDERQKGSVFKSAWHIGVVIVFVYIYFNDFEFSLVHDRSGFAAKQDKLLYYMPAMVFGISGMVGFYTGYLACKLKMQLMCFNIALVLATPITLLLLFLQCHLGFFKSTYSHGLTWFCPEFFTISASFESYLHLGIIVAWYFAEMVTGGHIWAPRGLRMDRMEK